MHGNAAFPAGMGVVGCAVSVEMLAVEEQEALITGQLLHLLDTAHLPGLCAVSSGSKGTQLPMSG